MEVTGPYLGMSGLDAVERSGRNLITTHAEMYH
jgi:hypothetical protein